MLKLRSAHQGESEVQNIQELLTKRSDAFAKGETETVSQLDLDLIGFAEDCRWEQEALEFVRYFAEIRLEHPEIFPPDWMPFAELAEWLNGVGGMTVYDALNAVPHDGEFIPAGPLDLTSLAASFAAEDQARVKAWWEALSDLQREVINGSLAEQWQIYLSFD